MRILCTSPGRPMHSRARHWVQTVRKEDVSNHRSQHVANCCWGLTRPNRIPTTARWHEKEEKGWEKSNWISACGQDRAHHMDLRQYIEHMYFWDFCSFETAENTALRQVLVCKNLTYNFPRNFNHELQSPSAHHLRKMGLFRDHRQGSE